jgi:hypothetical protein
MAPWPILAQEYSMVGRSSLTANDQVRLKTLTLNRLRIALRDDVSRDARAGLRPLHYLCQHKSMEPERPDHEQTDPETERIIHDRLATLDQDKKSAKDARQALDEIRRKLKHHPAPR